MTKHLGKAGHPQQKWNLSSRNGGDPQPAACCVQTGPDTWKPTALSAVAVRLALLTCIICILVNSIDIFFLSCTCERLKLLESAFMGLWTQREVLRVLTCGLARRKIRGRRASCSICTLPSLKRGYSDTSGVSVNTFQATL